MLGPRVETGGFTLVELLIVVLLIGSSAVIVGPALVPDRPLVRDVARVLRVLERARQHAAREGVRLEVELCPDGAYEIRVLDDPDASNGPRAGRVAGHLGLSGTITGLDQQGLVVAFGAQGRASQRTVVVRSGDGRAATLRIDPWTGSIDVRRD